MQVPRVHVCVSGLVGRAPEISRWFWTRPWAARPTRPRLGNPCIAATQGERCWRTPPFTDDVTEAPRNRPARTRTQIVRLVCWAPGTKGFSTEDLEGSRGFVGFEGFWGALLQKGGYWKHDRLPAHPWEGGVTRARKERDPRVCLWSLRGLLPSASWILCLLLPRGCWFDKSGLLAGSQDLQQFLLFY